MAKVPERRGSKPARERKAYDYNALVKLARRNGATAAEAQTLAAIALAESSGRERAFNRNNNKSTDYGLWQINTVHTKAGFDTKRAFNPDYNAQWAIRVMREAKGFTPWVAYKNGAYKKYVPPGSQAAVAAGAGAGRGAVAPAPAPVATRTAAPAVSGNPGQGGVPAADASFAQRMAALIAAAPGKVTVTSAGRSPERQRQLWEEALRKYGDPEIADNWVARPGGSNHEKGLANDLKFENDATRKWVHANASRFGLAFPLGNEPWHIEPVEARGKKLSGEAVKAGFKPIGQVEASAAAGGAPAAVGYDPSSMLGPDGKVDTGKAMEQYGYIAELANSVPDIKKTLDAAIKAGWTVTRFQAELQKTQWWRKTSETQRANEVLKKTNPGEYRARRQAMIDKINIMSRRLGAPEGKQRTFILAERFLSMGTSDEEIQRLLAADVRLSPSAKPGTPGAGKPNTGQAAVTADALRARARVQRVDLSDAELQQWLSAVLRGDQSIDAFDSFVLSEAKKRNPDMPASAFERGLTVDQFVTQTSATASSLEQVSKRFLVPLSQQALKKWAGQIVAGDLTVESFESYVKEQAKSLFPTLSAAIDRGVTVAQYAEPYRQIAAQTLEINPEDVDFSDPMYGRALLQVDPKTGERTSMGLAEYQEYLRKQPQWRRTRQANEQAASLTESLLKTFGQVA